MNNDNIKALHWSVYVVYAFLLTVILLFTLFPTEKFMRYCEYRLSSMIPGTAWKLENMAWSFPAGVSFDSVTVNSGKPNISEIVQVTNVKLTFRLLELGKSFSFSGGLYGGEIEGDVKRNSLSQQYSLSDCSMSDVDLSKMAYLRKQYDRKFEGKLSGKLQLQGRLGEKSVQDGNGHIKIVQGDIEIKNSILALEQLEFKQLSFDFDIKDNVGNIAKGILSSEQLQADFSGSLENLLSEESALSLKGKLVLQNSFFENKPQVLRVVKRLQKQHKTTALPFLLSGKLISPVLNFNE